MASSVVVQSNPTTEKGVFLYSSRGGRELATTGPRYTEQDNYELLHSCSPYFLTAPLRFQYRSKEQMPNYPKCSDARDGCMGIYALNATLENAGLKYCDLDDREKRKRLKAAGVWGLPKLRRGPKGKAYGTTDSKA